MIQITDKSQCCGCTACACVCHNNAITMQPDAMGFLYPMVDEAKCVGCGLCGETCAFIRAWEKLKQAAVVRHS